MKKKSFLRNHPTRKTHRWTIRIRDSLLFRRWRRSPARPGMPAICFPSPIESFERRQPSEKKAARRFPLSPKSFACCFAIKFAWELKKLRPTEEDKGAQQGGPLSSFWLSAKVNMKMQYYVISSTSTRYWLVGVVVVANEFTLFAHFVVIIRSISSY